MCDSCESLLISRSAQCPSMLAANVWHMSELEQQTNEPMNQRRWTTAAKVAQGRPELAADVEAYRVHVAKLLWLCRLLPMYCHDGLAHGTGEKEHCSWPMYGRLQLLMMLPDKGINKQINDQIFFEFISLFFPA